MVSQFQDHEALVPVDLRTLLIPEQFSLGLFPPPMEAEIAKLEQEDSGPFCVLELAVSPLTLDMPPQQIRVVLGAEMTYALLGALQARVDDMLSGLPADRAGYLNGLRADGRRRWLQGVTRVRAMYEEYERRGPQA